MFAHKTATINKILARPRLLYMAAVGLFLVDRALKFIATAPGLQPVGGRLATFDLFLNRGIAFSLQLPPPVFWFLTTIAFTALILALVSTRRSVVYQPLTAPLTLILLGALSNLWDRLAIGATIDYLIFFRTSAINLADVMIVGGMILVLIALPERIGKRTA